MKKEEKHAGPSWWDVGVAFYAGNLYGRSRERGARRPDENKDGFDMGVVIATIVAFVLLAAFFVWMYCELLRLT